MVYKATRLIQQEMDEDNVNYMIQDDDDQSAIIAGFSVKNGPSVRAIFISKNDNNDVAIRLYGLISDVADQDKLKIYEVINSVHNQYRFLNFSLDEDGDLNVSYDLPQNIPDEGVGPACVEIFVRIMDILNKVYPMFMIALWS